MSAVKTKKKNIQPISKGCIYVHATFNNTIITITGPSGNVISWSSAGESGFKGTKKSTPFAAQSAVKNALTKASEYNMQSANVFISGIGNGRDAALRAIVQNGVEINLIKDITPLPHNGVRAKKPRRV